jgi:hypothetical protein
VRTYTFWRSRVDGPGRIVSSNCGGSGRSSLGYTVVSFSVRTASTGAGTVVVEVTTVPSDVVTRNRYVASDSTITAASGA